MKVYWKYFMIPFLYGIIFSWNAHMNGHGIIDICQIAVYQGNGYIWYCTFEAVLETIKTNFIYYMFIIVFSTYIYRHFCNSSVYVFSRCENRMKWYVRECLKLFCFTVIGNIAVFVGFVVTALLGCGMTSSKESIWIVFVYFAIYSLWIFASVLLANIISIIKNSVIGNLTVMGILNFLLLRLTSIDYQNFTSREHIKMRSNPMSYTILSWYKMNIEDITGIEKLEYACNPWMGIIVLSVCCMAVFFIGAMVIQKIDIIKNNTDN